METIYEKTCIVCGQDFTAKRYTAKTCSPKCRITLCLSRKIAGNTNIITDDIPPATTPVITDVKIPSITPETPVIDMESLVRDLLLETHVQKSIVTNITDLKQLIDKNNLKITFEGESEKYLYWGYFNNGDELLKLTKEKGREHDVLNSRVIEDTDTGFYFFEKI